MSLTAEGREHIFKLVGQALNTPDCDVVISRDVTPDQMASEDGYLTYTVGKRLTITIKATVSVEGAA